MSSFQSWLPVALPAHARRVRVDDPDLMALLAAAGAEVVECGPDVEIASRIVDLRHDAPHVILSMGSNQPEGGGRLVRAWRRAAASVKVRTAARAARKRLRSLGYRGVRVIPWDFDQPVQLPGGGVHRRRIVEFLPERAVVCAHRESSDETLLDAVVAQVSQAIGQPVRYQWPLMRAGILVIVADSCVIRIAVGPAGQRLLVQRDVIERLSRADDIIVERLPWPVHIGRVGLGDWSVEAHLDGAPVAGEIPTGLLWECMEFLAALHHVEAQGAHRSLADDARRCATICPTQRHGHDLIALGEDLDRLLLDVPRGFGHGDFWTGNLLCENGRLNGVIDWDGGGPGRLPLLDLIHLQVSSYRDGRHVPLGNAIIASQLAVARAGGDEVTRAYCRRVGLDPDARILEALVLAFWIDRTVLELDLRPDTITPAWVDANVVTVLDHLR